MSTDTLKKNYFAYLVAIMTILLASASLYRFYIQQDYLVAYEGDCDPATESCYLYCEDDECTEPFYYSVIERGAATLYDMCGPDVTECDKAYSCEGDETCAIYFCDPEIDGEEACVTGINSFDDL